MNEWKFRIGHQSKPISHKFPSEATIEQVLRELAIEHPEVDPEKEPVVSWMGKPLKYTDSLSSIKYNATLNFHIRLTPPPPLFPASSSSRFPASSSSPPPASSSSPPPASSSSPPPASSSSPPPASSSSPPPASSSSPPPASSSSPPPASSSTPPPASSSSPPPASSSSPPPASSSTPPPASSSTSPPASFPTSSPASFPTSSPASFPTSSPASFPTPPPASFPTSSPASFSTPPPASFPTSSPASFSTPPSHALHPQLPSSNVSVPTVRPLVVTPRVEGTLYCFVNRGTNAKYHVNFRPETTIGSALEAVTNQHELVGNFIATFNGHDLPETSTLQSHGFTPSDEIILISRSLFDGFPEIRGDRLSDGSFVLEPLDPPRLPVDLVYLKPRPNQKAHFSQLLEQDPSQFDRVIDFVASLDQEIAQRLAVQRTMIFAEFDVLPLSGNSRQVYDNFTPTQKQFIHRLVREFPQVPVDMILTVARDTQFQYQNSQNRLREMQNRF